MATELISFRPAPYLRNKLTTLVEEGYYKNRTEAINDALRLLIRKHLAEMAREELMELRKRGKIDKSLSEALEEVREEEDQ